jgi:gas vesicle protein
MSTGKILLGVLAGVAAGAVLGILFAPDKGVATRKKISEKSDDYAEEIEEKFQEFVEGITNKFDSLKKDAAAMAKKAARKVEEADPEMSVVK